MKTVFVSIIFLFSSFVFASENTAPKTLQEFKTDYCTMFPEGTREEPNQWAHCCFAHDLRYWFGGTIQNRDTSDEDLYWCVAKVARAEIARLIYDGVRAGHASPIKSQYSWGWGWKPPVTNRALTREEKVVVHERLWEMDLDPEFRKEFIRKYLRN